MEYSTKNLIFKQFFKRNLYRKMIVLLLAIYREIDSESSTQSNYSICNSIQYDSTNIYYKTLLDMCIHIKNGQGGMPLLPTLAKP